MVTRNLVMEWINASVDVDYFRNLDNCIKDAEEAAQDMDGGPKDATNFSELHGRLEACRSKLPPLYSKNVCKFFIETLDGLGQAGFNQILSSDPKRENGACLMLEYRKPFCSMEKATTKRLQMPSRRLSAICMMDSYRLRIGEI